MRTFAAASQNASPSPRPPESGLETIPDSWPSPGLEETIDRDRAFWTGKRTMVTGAFGFVGGHLARALHAAGAQVTALDTNTSPDHCSQIDMVGLRHEMEVVNADITHRMAMQEIVHQGNFDYIFHLAAGATTVEKAIQDPYSTILANTMGFVNLAEASRLLPGDQRPVLLYSSTDKVYGETENLPYDEEKSELRGVGVYDAAKLAADIFANTYHQELGLDTIVLRMCNLFGPYDMNYDYRLIPKAMRNIFRDHDAPDLYFASLQHHRDFLYVEDAARAFMLLAREEKCRGHVYNLPGTHYAPTPEVLRDVVDTLADMQQDAQRSGGDPRRANHEWNRHIRLLQTDNNVVVISKQHLDGTKIKNATGFEPAISFRDGLRRTIAFYAWYFNLKKEAESDDRDMFGEMPPGETMQPASLSPTIPAPAWAQDAEEDASTANGNGSGGKLVPTHLMNHSS
jgi:nucleoside-diphosphate-sugar epimerase